MILSRIKVQEHHCFNFQSGSKIICSSSMKRTIWPCESSISFKTKLKELKSASAKAWKKVEAEMNAAMEELNKQYDKMISYFNKK